MKASFRVSEVWRPFNNPQSAIDCSGSRIRSVNNPQSTIRNQRDSEAGWPSSAPKKRPPGAEDMKAAE
jgi:hypothetical protein